MTSSTPSASAANPEPEGGGAGSEGGFETWESMLDSYVVGDEEVALPVDDNEELRNHVRGLETYDSRLKACQDRVAGMEAELASRPPNYDDQLLVKIQNLEIDLLEAIQRDRIRTSGLSKSFLSRFRDRLGGKEVSVKLTDHDGVITGKLSSTDSQLNLMLDNSLVVPHQPNDNYASTQSDQITVVNGSMVELVLLPLETGLDNTSTIHDTPIEAAELNE